MRFFFATRFDRCHRNCTARPIGAFQIAGGLQVATGAAGGLFTPGVQVAQETSQILGPEGQPAVKEVLTKAPSAIGGVVNAVKDALPEEATMEQAMKIPRIVYHLGLGTSGAAFLWHELFGKK